jgi:hypothetical protein
MKNAKSMIGEVNTYGKGERRLKAFLFAASF